MSAEQLLEKLDQLPPMPDVCLRLGALIHDPNCTANQVARLIETDAALTSRLLRVANSAFYSIPGGISSVQRAITTLGFSAVHQLVLCALSRDLLDHAGTPLPAWANQHNQAVSVISHKLAAQLRAPHRDVAMAAGLLHDVGRMAVLALWPEGLKRYEQALEGGATHSLSLERELMGQDHLQIATRLATLWKYPANLRDAIVHHHREKSPAEDLPLSLSDVIAVADAWAHALTGNELVLGLEGKGHIALEPSRLAKTGLTAEPQEAERDALLQAIRGGVSI